MNVPALTTPMVHIVNCSVIAANFNVIQKQENVTVLWDCMEPIVKKARFVWKTVTQSFVDSEDIALNLLKKVED